VHKNRKLLFVNSMGVEVRRKTSWGKKGGGSGTKKGDSKLCSGREGFVDTWVGKKRQRKGGKDLGKQARKEKPGGSRVVLKVHKELASHLRFFVEL